MGKKEMNSVTKSGAASAKDRAKKIFFFMLKPVEHTKRIWSTYS
jgi:hypothetical protein